LAENESKVKMSAEKSSEQIEKFIKTARQLKVDESDNALDDIMGKLNFEKPKDEGKSEKGK